MNASMYILLLLAVIFVNIPFLNNRLLCMFKLKRKHFGHHLLELLLGFLITATLASLLELRMGHIHQQGWKFYVIVVCLYLIFAFPAFVWRYFWHHKHQQ